MANVADKSPCPRCHKVTFVRFETVVKGGALHRAYYCGACDYAWNDTAGGVNDPQRDVTPDHPDRSRPRGR